MHKKYEHLNTEMHKSSRGGPERKKHIRPQPSADVVPGAHDRVLSSHAGGALEESIHHALPALDILLVIGDVSAESRPLVGLLRRLLSFSHNTAPALGHAQGHIGRNLALASQECRARHSALHHRRRAHGVHLKITRLRQSPQPTVHLQPSSPPPCQKK
jgi:hypothetical protein